MKDKKEICIKRFMPEDIPIYLKPAVKYVVKHIVSDLEYFHMLCECNIEINKAYKSKFKKIDVNKYMRKYIFSWLYDVYDEDRIMMYTAKWLIAMGYKIKITHIPLSLQYFLQIQDDETPGI